MLLVKNLSFLLERKNITLSLLSKNTGISVKTLHNWTTGQEPKKLTQVKLVAEYFNETIDRLCFEDIATTKNIKQNPIDEHRDEIRAGIFEVVLRPIKK